MGATAFASGTQTAVIGTEHFLSSPNEAGTYLLTVDCVNMAAGDVLELRGLKMVLTGGTARVLYFSGQIQDVQDVDDLIKESDPITQHLAEANGVRFSLKQTAGVGRNFPWTVTKIA